MSSIPVKFNPAKISTIIGEIPAIFRPLITKSGWIDIFLPLLPIFIALLFASSSVKPAAMIKMDLFSNTKINLPEIK